MSFPSVLKIALAQYGFDKLATLDQWEGKIRRWVRNGAETGAKLLVFPEYGAIEMAGCLGAEISGDLQKTLECVADLAERRVQFHASLAAEYDVHILVGSGPLKNSNGRFVNGAHLVAPNGLVGCQEKLMMTPFEVEWGVQGGAALRLFETAIGRIGVLICYDCEFPLLGRALVEAGADILLVPSCTERVSGFHRVQIGARARALEGGVVVVQSATVGEALWSPVVDFNVGAAGIYVPPDVGISDNGGIAQGELNEVGWITGSIDLKVLQELRTNGEMRNFEDWSSQPGGVELGRNVELVNFL